MDASTEREDDLARAAALRRRLYRPGATEEDRRAYAALVAAIERDSQATIEPGPVDALEPTRVAAIEGDSRATIEPWPIEPIGPTRVAAIERDPGAEIERGPLDPNGPGPLDPIGHGPVDAIGPARVAEQPDASPTAPRGRRRLVLLGVAGGVLAVVAAAAVAQQTAAPTLLLPAVPITSATIGPAPDQPVVRLASGGGATQEFRGRGAGTAPLDSSTTGRLEVMITLSDPASVHWSARRVEIHLDGDQYVRVLDQHRTTQAGAVPSTYRYDGVPPTSIRVEVPTGIAWSLVVLPRR